MTDTPDSGGEAETLSARSRYEQLTSHRLPYEERARDVAKVTIPSLFPPAGASPADPFPQPFQAIGARGVNNLASKLLLALLPPGSPFFRLRLAEKVIKELQAREDGDTVRGKVEQALSLYETSVVNKMEASGSRIVVYEALRQIIVAGNVLVHVMKRGAMRYFRLDSYVVVRDGEGNVLEIVVKEKLDRLTLPPHIAARVPEPRIVNGTCENPECELFTRIGRTKRGWVETQELDGVLIPEATSKYPIDKCPWLPLRFSRIAGEHYGRSYGDELIGDLRSCDLLSESLVDFAAVASRVVFLVAPGSETRVDDIVNAASGDAVEGKKEDVGALQLDKYADFQVVKAVVDAIEQRLGAAFLLNSSVQRQAERVTAEEVRYVAQELEQGLGGIYSILAQEFQRPVVELQLAQATRDKDLPQLPKDTVRPEIITGLDALGRTSDLMRQDSLLRGVSEIFGPQAISEYVSAGEYITRRAAALSIDTKGLIRSEEDVQKERAAARQQALVEKLGPEAMRQQGAQQQQQQPAAAEQPA